MSELITVRQPGAIIEPPPTMDFEIPRKTENVAYKYNMEMSCYFFAIQSIMWLELPH